MSAPDARLTSPLKPDALWTIGSSRAVVYLAAAALGLAAIASRVPIAGRYLFDWDSLQFALGMQRFNLAAHRPHPPGYLGYIAVGKVATGLLGGDVNLGLVALSIVAESLTVVAIFLVVSRLLGRFAGLAAAVLMLSSPLFWLYGETALTYGLEPGLSLLGFWLVYRAVENDGRGLATASLVIGLAGAIRPSAEFFLLPLLGAGVGLMAWNASRRSRLTPRRLGRLAGLPLLALILGTSIWLVPLLYLSGGPGPYLYYSAQLAARVSVNSAVWRAGIGGLAANSRALFAGLAVSLGLYLPLAASTLAIDRVPALAPGGRKLPRQLALLTAIWIAPATATFLLVHIGQLAYVLYILPALLLPAGLVLDRVAQLLVGRWPAWQTTAKVALLLTCAGTNLAAFALPGGSLLAQLQARDRHVEALQIAVRGYQPSRTVLIADPEGPGSYRTAMYYLSDYQVIALGRDRSGRAGEMFSNRAGAPEYDLRRFEQAGPMRLPTTGTALVLDETLLSAIGDPYRLHAVGIADPLARHLFVFELDPTDPPIARRSWIYLRSSDYYQYRTPSRSCAVVRRWSCPAATQP